MSSSVGGGKGRDGQVNSACLEAGSTFASSYIGLECYRLPASLADDNEPPRCTMAVHFVVGEGTAFYETGNVVGRGRSRWSDNKLARRRTTSNVVACWRARFYGTRKAIGQGPVKRGDNKWPVVRNTESVRLCGDLRGSQQVAVSYNDGRSCRPAPGPEDDNNLACRTTAADVLAWAWAEAMTTDGLIVRIAGSHRSPADPRDRQQPASVYAGDTFSRPDAGGVPDNRWLDCHSCKTPSGFIAFCQPREPRQQVFSLAGGRGYTKSEEPSAMGEAGGTTTTGLVVRLAAGEGM